MSSYPAWLPGEWSWETHSVPPFYSLHKFSLEGELKLHSHDVTGMVEGCVYIWERFLHFMSLIHCVRYRFWQNTCEGFLVWFPGAEFQFDCVAARQIILVAFVKFLEGLFPSFSAVHLNCGDHGKPLHHSRRFVPKSSRFHVSNDRETELYYLWHSNRFLDL